MYNGAWDYPANVRGYNYGVAFDFNQKYWALRYGVFGEPTFPNGTAIDPRFLDAQGHVLELEERYTYDNHPGKIRFLAYLNHAHMGNYREALVEMPVNPDLAPTRAYRIKYGFGVNIEQEWTETLGGFLRAGWNNGQSETWAFTEIDSTLAMGLVLKGKRWCRPQDQVGLGFVMNGLSDAHRDYLAAGGLGFIIGDGRLNYGLEKIIETFYDWQIVKGIFVTADFQGVDHPAYNRDRGPVAIGTLRAHIEF
jgi:high affinity Mn2+ porin